MAVTTSAAEIPEIDCVDFVPRTGELLETEPPTWPAVLVRHMDDCPPCATFVHQLIDLKDILRSTADDAVLSPLDPRITVVLAHARTT
jgi:hypothetical protein